MTLAIRPQVSAFQPSTTPERNGRLQHPRVGEAVADLGRRYADAMNSSDFAVALREHRVSRRNYAAFVATMYPVVVGFNGALIRSISKVDHVRQSSLVKMLAQQLEEEQAHNQLWRAMLEVHDLEHETLYNDLEEYRERFTTEELTTFTQATLEAVRLSLTPGPRIFPDAIFPDAVLALCQHLSLSAGDATISYWEHFASQAGIEMVIYDVVTTTILPGVVRHPELDRGVASTHWWMEHGRPPGPQAHHRTDEEKHLALSKMALNRSETANALGPAVTARAEDAMRLFAAALLAQHPQAHAFPVERYLKSPSA
jgi:hypothetical protein